MKPALWFASASILTLTGPLAAHPLAAQSVSSTRSQFQLRTQSTVARWARWSPSSGGSQNSVNNYAVDDGTTENSLGLVNGGDMVWIQKFTAVGGADSITKVRTAFGSTGSLVGETPPPGTAIKVFVWEDPNNDGNPVDGILVSTGSGTITNIDNDVFDTFAVAPAPVVGVFHVGVVCPQLANQFPGPMDTGSYAAGQTWVTGEPAANTYTGSPVSGSVGLYDVGPIGYPANWLLRAEGGSSSTVYCTAKVNSLNCTPAIGDSGTPSATASSGHPVQSTNNRNQKAGLLFYGDSGRAAGPFQGGTLCVKTPIKRTPAVTSGGNPLPANDCSGVYSIDMNTFAQGGLGGSPLASLKTPGTIVDCQFWGRDPGFPAPNNTSLSDGLEYTVGP
jgi:hypothetical protein